MRRSIIALSLVLTAASALAGCGGEHSMDSSGMPHGHDESTPVADGARRIEVGAQISEFTPDEITVKRGEDVAIALTSSDILHDFTVDGLNAHVAAQKGQTREGGLRADKPGEYTFYCSVEGHREAGMTGTLVVTEQ